MREIRYCIYSIGEITNNGFPIIKDNRYTIGYSRYIEDARSIVDDLNLANEFKSKTEQYGLITVPTNVTCEFPESKVRSFFTLAGFSIINVFEIINGYNGIVEQYSSPWWVVYTNHGLIKIGKRKHVFEIDWSGTSLRSVITDENVTKGETYVHAWTEPKVLEYLIDIRKALEDK